ncbi:MAG: hypothetical protein BIFFINMI_00913 [Phycisphaerae bacterium]|nr:hypothetical protein [Phycisphaerae bacterium]
MRRTAWLSIWALGAIGLLARPVATARAVEVKLQAAETADVARSPAVITAGVPFARGAVRDVAGLVVSVAGKPIPAQFSRLAPWPDGSVRWALMDVQADVPAGGKVDLTVSDGGNNPAPASPVKVEMGADVVTVLTGPLTLALNRKGVGLFGSIKVDGKERVTSAGRGLVVYTADGKEVPAGPPTEVTVEQAGPLRAVVCLRGKFPGLHDGLLSYTVRVTAFAGQKFVKVHAWLQNDGAMGYFVPKDYERREQEVPAKFEWFAFKGMSVELNLCGNEVARCEGVEGTGDFKVLQTCLHSRTKRAGESQGPFYTWSDFDYVITGGGKELKRGERTDGVVSLAGQTGALLTVAIRDFWQNYEKAIERNAPSTGAGPATLKLWLWPVGGQWPRPYYWLTYGIDKTIVSAIKPGMYLLPGGMHKGHEFILDFSGRDAKASSATLSAPLTALASAEYYATTEASIGLFAPAGVRTPDDDGNAKLDSQTRMMRSMVGRDDPAGLFMARRTSDYSSCAGVPSSTYWFGWMDYGDLCASGHGPVGLAHDWVRIALSGALRTGDPTFMELAAAMARHRIDVDQLWSDRDPAEFGVLQRGDSNWPSYHCASLRSPPTPADNWLAGVVLYYMLTGEPQALECANRNADGLARCWAWIDQSRTWGYLRGDMAANAQGIESFCAMYDLTADKKWLDLAMRLFDGHVVPKWKDLGPFLHDPTHQIRSQDYIQEDMKYCYSIPAFCELHRRTGDKNVFKLLEEGCEKDFPDSFFQAPLFLSDLYAYVALKTGNRDLLDKAAESFGVGFPESKCPPVFLAANSIWTRTSAMMLRTGSLLQYAAWKMAQK